MRRGERGLLQLLDSLKGKNKILEFEGGHTRWPSVGNPFWKRLWTHR